jgi:hypothetical protein
MLIISRRRYVKRHVVGWAGIMDKAVNVLGRPNAAKQIATVVGKKAVEAVRITQKTRDTLARLVNEGIVKNHGSGMKVV